MGSGRIQKRTENAGQPEVWISPSFYLSAPTNSGSLRQSDMEKGIPGPLCWDAMPIASSCFPKEEKILLRAVQDFLGPGGNKC
jgi:hypothetical protein